MSSPTLATRHQPRRHPRLPIAVGLLFAVSSIFTLAVPADTMAWASGDFSSSSESDLVALTNRSRANAGLKALKVDATLRSVARWRSKDMIERDYFSHSIPGYGKVWDKLNNIGYCYKAAGENIGWNNYPDDLATAAVHQAFMNSSGHRANIMGSTWDVVGIGAYKGPTGKKMWTVLFANKCGTTSNPTPKPTPKPTAKPRPTQRPAPRPTPRPTPKATKAPTRVAVPTPVETPIPTPFPIFEPTPPLSSGNLLPPDEASPSTDSEPAETPDAIVDDGTGPGMRVVDRNTSDGLLGTIVGGVAGFFFGG